MALTVAQGFIPVDEPIGGKAPKQGLFFHQEYLRSRATRSEGGCHTGNAAPHNQHVRTLADGRLQPFHKRIHAESIL